MLKILSMYTLCLWNRSRSASPDTILVVLWKFFSILYGIIILSADHCLTSYPILKLWTETCPLMSVTPHLSLTLYRIMPWRSWLTLISLTYFILHISWPLPSYLVTSKTTQRASILTTYHWERISLEGCFFSFSLHFCIVVSKTLIY